MSDFYDRLAGLYHLIFPNWDESIERQAGQLASTIHDRWGGRARAVLDGPVSTEENKRHDRMDVPVPPVSERIGEFYRPGEPVGG